MIIVVRFGYDDVDTWKPEVMDKLFSWWKEINNDKHGQHFHEQKKYFSIFVLSVDGVMGKVD